MRLVPVIVIGAVVLSTIGIMTVGSADREAEAEEMVLERPPLHTARGLPGQSVGGRTVESGQSGFVRTAPEVDPGRAVSIKVDGDLTLDRDIIAPPGDSPGDNGTDVWIQVGGALVLGNGVQIRASDGIDGRSVDQDAEAVAGAGGRGGNIWIEAQVVIANGNHLMAGNGGNGGSAISLGDPDAYAVGGAGGMGGVVAVHRSTTLIGKIHVDGGDGGDGGPATGKGADHECDSRDGEADRDEGKEGEMDERGGDATAQGERASCGPVDGDGGKGGGAHAFGGKGGMSIQGDGGRGGNAVAFAGVSGSGMDACFPSSEAAEASGIRRAGNGGYGGDYQAVGGDGGEAMQPLGGDGGAGGSAEAGAWSGYGGNATAPIGRGNPLGSDPDGLYEVIGGNGGTGASGGNGGGAAGGITHLGIGGYCGGEEDYIPGVNVLIVIALIGGLLHVWHSRRS